MLGAAVPSQREESAWSEGVAIWVAVAVVSLVGERRPDSAHAWCWLAGAHGTGGGPGRLPLAPSLHRVLRPTAMQGSATAQRCLMLSCFLPAAAPLPAPPPLF